MLRIFVTGGAGYIGSHVVKALGEKGYEVLTYDNLSYGRADAVLYGSLFIGDLSDRERLREAFEAFKPDVVMHFAAYVVVPESVREPSMYYRNNFCNTLNLIDTCLEFKVNKFIFSSTAAVYGVPEVMPINEKAPLNPVNPYGRSKMMVENILPDIAAVNKFNYVALRYFNVAGADEKARIGQNRKDATHLITVAVRTAIGTRPYLEVYGTDYPTPDGTCIRDYIHVDDLSSAHLAALEYIVEGGKNDVFNCGYGHGYSVQEVAGTVKIITGADFRVVESARRPGDPPEVIADNTKIKSDLNWTPQHDDLHYIIKTAFEWEKKISTATR